MKLSQQEISDLADMAASFARYNFTSKAESITEGCESPIEERLALAIDVWFGLAMGAQAYFFFDKSYEWSESAEVRFAPVSVFKQAKVGPYRVDLLLGLKGGDGPAQFIAVECDGHQFHERTKEQAAHDRARDRWMTTNNLKVLRFTGSEIFRDPLNCAGQIFTAWMKMP